MRSRFLAFLATLILTASAAAAQIAPDAARKPAAPCAANDTLQYLVENGRLTCWALAAVATSGDYADLTGKPTIPSVCADLADAGTGCSANVTGTNTGDQDLSGYALKADPLSQFAATTSDQLADVLTDEAGASGGFVRESALDDVSATIPADCDDLGDAAASCSTDATNASNITSGTLANGRTTATATNTPDTIVLRDGSGNFAAGTITAALAGNASTATALAANGANCSGTQKPAGVDASGASEGCSAIAYADVTGTPTIPTPGGSDTYCQFNDGGSFGGDAGCQYDKTNDVLGLGTSTDGKVRLNLGGTTSAGATTYGIADHSVVASDGGYAGHRVILSTGNSLTIDSIGAGHYEGVTLGSGSTLAVNYGWLADNLSVGDLRSSFISQQDTCSDCWGWLSLGDARSKFGAEGIILDPKAGTPTSPTNGQIAYDSTGSDSIYARVNGADRTIALYPTSGTPSSSTYWRGDETWAPIAGVGSPLTTKGDIYVFGSANDRLPAGTNNYVLTPDSAQSLGLKWQSLSAQIDAVFSSTQGSILYRGASAWGALAPGAANYFLQSQGSGADPAYAMAVHRLTVNTSTIGVDSTTLSVSGLSLDTDIYYLVTWSLWNASGSACNISLYVNSDTTASNYDRMTILADGGTVTSGRANDGIFGVMQGSRQIMGYFFLFAVPDSQKRALGMNEEVNSGGANNLSVRSMSWAWRTASTNVTGLTLSGSVANCIKGGSNLSVYRLRTG